MIPLRDSRTMHGSRPLAGPDEVRAVWNAYAADRVARDGGFANRSPAEMLEDRTADPAIVPHVSDGRWCADCPECRGGMACAPDMPDACCFDCGRVFAIDWPPAGPLVAAVELLEQRDPINRHWRPLDESHVDLRREALARGELRGPVELEHDERLAGELERWRGKVAR